MDSRTGELLSPAQIMRAIEFNNSSGNKTSLPFHLKFLYAHQSVSKRTILKFQLQVNYRERKQLGFHKIFLQFRIISTRLTGATHSWIGILTRLRWRICNDLDSLGFFSLNNLYFVIDNLPKNM
ncbi:C3 [Sweet potato golden vein Korea virus]|uniref:Replication enhancer n=1 Tax=Sweet potato golden vein Korea virus TaxID=2169736 RepID=A0A170QHC1_9GEMI|nr:C3 [Sweet potato golden vein Korea virus]AMY63155.1 C3 [Sweet potato golden vein Korea virus]